MNFKVLERENEKYPFTRVLFGNDFQSSLSIRESEHIQTEDGMPLKTGSYYLITKVKVTGHPVRPFIWGLMDRENYSPKFKDLLNKIVPGMTNKTIFIVKFVVKEI